MKKLYKIDEKNDEIIYSGNFYRKLKPSFIENLQKLYEIDEKNDEIMRINYITLTGIMLINHCIYPEMHFHTSYMFLSCFSHVSHKSHA